MSSQASILKLWIFKYLNKHQINEFCNSLKIMIVKYSNKFNTLYKFNTIKELLNT